MTGTPLPLVIGALCFALAAAYDIRFTNNVAVSTASAIAPAVALVGVGSDGVSRLLLAVAPVSALVLALILRRPLRETARHIVLFGIVSGVVFALGSAGVRDVLVRALVGGSLYLAGEYAAQRVTAETSLVAKGDRRTWFMLHGVLICACGLTALGVDRLDWPAFIAMALVLFLTKREFEAFALSRTAFEQTVAAIEKLKAIDANDVRGETSKNTSSQLAH